jgi:hypothetical protein
MGTEWDQRAELLTVFAKKSHKRQRDNRGATSAVNEQINVLLVAKSF